MFCTSSTSLPKIYGSSYLESPNVEYGVGCAYSCGEKINLYFYVDKRRNYYFYFPRSYIRIITFKLLDYFYGNPIGKGELILWQK